MRELKQQIFQTHDEVVRPIASQQAHRKLTRIVWAWLQNKRSTGKRIASSPEAKKTGPWLAAYEVVAENSLKNMLICFDDIERRGANLRLLDFLGLVTFLSEERNCNVLVIANTEVIEAPGDEWTKHREKVFRQEYTYDPSSEQCVSLVAPPRQGILVSTVERSLVELDVRNIRIIQRTFSLLALVEEAIKQSGLSERAMAYFARSLALASFCYNGAGEGAISLDLAVKHSAEGYTSLAANSELRSAWSVLASYRHYFIGGIDEIVIKLVRNGMIEPEELQATLRMLEGDESELDWSQFYSDTWAMWRNSFHDNSQDLIPRFEAIANRPMKGMGSSSATSVARALRDLNRPDLAMIMLENWVASKIPDHMDDLAERELRLGEADAVLFELSRQALERETPALPLAAAFALATREYPAPERLVLTVSRTSSSELAGFLRPFCSELVAKSVYTLTRLPDSPREPYLSVAREVTHDALRLLAQESPFLASKLERTYASAFPVPSG